ncbi:MAG: YfiR family protein [Vicinamibacterales bacterium]
MVQRSPLRALDGADRRARAVRLVAAVVLAAWLPSSLAAQPAAEYDMKAAFLLNFAKYVTWPSAAFARPSALLEVCQIDTDPFGPVLARAITGRAAGGRMRVSSKLPTLAPAVIGAAEGGRR